MFLLFLSIATGEFLYNEGYRPVHLLFWLAVLTVVLLYATIAGMALDFNARFGAPVGGPDAVMALSLIVVFFLLTGMILAAGRETPVRLFQRHSRLVWGVLYLGCTYPVVFLVGNGGHGIHGGDAMLFLFGLLWIGDTAAMGIGSRLGRYKLAPAVSPNKTVEGFIGGVVGALAVGLLMYFWKFQSLGLWHTMTVAAGCSVVGQMGDLVESMWKRSLDIKDSSSIIPGHGGVLDRFDSLLFAAPFMYAYFYFVSK